MAVDSISRSTTLLRVGVCQIPVSFGDLAGNRALAREAVLDAVRLGARVIVLPELMNSGYVFEDQREARRFAEPLSGATLLLWTRLARDHRVVIVGGFCEISSRGAIYNSSVLIDKGEVRAVYRKAHLWSKEKEIFAPGCEPPPVVKTALGCLSMMICYDVEFPEWVRLAAIQGADLICVPTNWPRLAPDPGAYPVEVLRVLANANMNMTYVAAAARLGTERGVDWVAGSGIASPLGAWLTPLTNDAAVLVADIQISAGRSHDIESHGDYLVDRRPELYGDLSAALPMSEQRTPTQPPRWVTMDPDHE